MDYLKECLSASRQGRQGRKMLEEIPSFQYSLPTGRQASFRYKMKICNKLDNYYYFLDITHVILIF